VTLTQAHGPDSREPGGARLKLAWPVGRRLAWTALWLILIVGMAEALARAPAVQSHFPAPSYGSVNRQFELQLARISAFVADHGQPDCLFLGSSQVLRGIDPLAFAEAYRSATGEEVHCFSFGVRGLDAEAANAVVRVLLQRYSPRVLVLGTDIPGYSTNTAEGVRGGKLTSMDWVRYRLGEPNLNGWLIDHSVALRTYLPFRYWYLPAFAKQQVDADSFDTQITPEGFGRLEHRSDNIADSPTRDDPQASFFDILHDFTLDEAQLAALDRLLTLRPTLPMIIVEMPLHPTFFDFFGNGKADFDRGLSIVRAHIQPTGVQFIETTELQLIPDAGWANRNHLNTRGADLFSRWLGLQIAERVLDGRLPALAASAAEGGTP